MDRADMSKDVEDNKHEAATIATKSVDEINAEARIALEAEHALSFADAVKLYPSAVGWALFFSLGIIMYDEVTQTT